MDAIEKQQKNQLEVIKKDDKTKNIAFLKWRIYINCLKYIPGLLIKEVKSCRKTLQIRRITLVTNICLTKHF